MKFSVFMITMGRGRLSDRQVYDDALADVRIAEHLGFDSFMFAEHHFNADFCMAIWKSSGMTVAADNSLAIFPAALAR